MNIKKKELLSKWYILSVIILLSLFWIKGNSEFLTNKIWVSLVTILLGFKFDLKLDIRNYWIFTRFQNRWLNTINIFVQFWANAVLIASLSYQNTTILSLLEILLCTLFGIFIFYPFFYFRTFDKSISFIHIIINISFVLILSVFLIFNLLSNFVSIFSLVQSDFLLALLSLLTTITVIYIWYKQHRQKNGFLTSVSWKLNYKLLTLIIFFLIGIFFIDSSLWLHPVNTWSFTLTNFVNTLSVGLREEFIFRGIILGFFLYVFKDTRRCIMYGVILQGIIFGVFHLINLLDPATSSDAVVFSTIDAAGIGILFAVILLITKNIWVPAMLHFIWDFFQISMTPEMNMSVSGIPGMIISSSVGLISIIFSFVIYISYQSNMIFKNK